MIRISLPLWLKHKLYRVPPGDGLIPLPPMPGAVVHAEARPRSNSVLADIVGYLGRKATSLLYPAPVRLPEPLHSELMEKFRATEKALLHSLRDVPQKDKGFCSPDDLSFLYQDESVPQSLVKTVLVQLHSWLLVLSGWIGLYVATWYSTYHNSSEVHRAIYKEALGAFRVHWEHYRQGSPRRGRDAVHERGVCIWTKAEGCEAEEVNLSGRQPSGV